MEGFASRVGTLGTPFAAKVVRVQSLIDKNRDAFEPVYAALIETLDDTIGMLMAKLEELRLAENTIFNFYIFQTQIPGLYPPLYTCSKPSSW